MRNLVFVILLFNFNVILGQGFQDVPINYNAGYYAQNKVKTYAYYLTNVDESTGAVKDSMMQEQAELNEEGLVTNYKLLNGFGQLVPLYSYEYDKKGRMLSKKQEGENGYVQRYEYCKKEVKSESIQLLNVPGSRSELCRKFKKGKLLKEYETTYKGKQKFTIESKTYDWLNDTVVRVKSPFFKDSIAIGEFLYTYDSRGRMREVKFSESYYNVDSSLGKAMVGSIISYEYNKDGFVRSVLQQYPTEKTFVRYTYEFNKLGLPSRQIIEDNIADSMFGSPRGEEVKRTITLIHHTFYE